MNKKRSEYYSYHPNSPLTLHYITTGAILPESSIIPNKLVLNTPLKRNIRTIKGKVCNRATTKKKS